jgi:hypothetical protein
MITLVASVAASTAPAPPTSRYRRRPRSGAHPITPRFPTPASVSAVAALNWLKTAHRTSGKASSGATLDEFEQSAVCPGPRTEAHQRGRERDDQDVHKRGDQLRDAAARDPRLAVNVLQIAHSLKALHRDHDATRGFGAWPRGVVDREIDQRGGASGLLSAGSPCGSSSSHRPTPARFRCQQLWREGVRLLWEKTVAVDDRGGEVDEFAVVDARPLAQHLKRGVLVDGVAFHEDALRAFDLGSAAERAFEVLILREAAQDNIDRALPVLDIIV